MSSIRHREASAVELRPPMPCDHDRNVWSKHLQKALIKRNTVPANIATNSGPNPADPTLYLGILCAGDMRPKAARMPEVEATQLANTDGLEPPVDNGGCR